MRSLGLAVKLDTNGYMPGILKDLCAKGLLDCVAMDIKAGRNHYEEAAGVSGLSMERIDESIEFLLSGFTKDEMMAFADLVRPYVGQVSLRGIDY